MREMNLNELEIEVVRYLNTDEELYLDHFKLDALIKVIPGALETYESLLREHLTETRRQAREGVGRCKKN